MPQLRGEGSVPSDGVGSVRQHPDGAAEDGELLLCAGVWAPRGFVEGGQGGDGNVRWFDMGAEEGAKEGGVFH